MVENKILKAKVNAAWKMKNKFWLWFWSIIITLFIDYSMNLIIISIAGILVFCVPYSILATISYSILRRKITKEYNNGF